MRKIVVFLILTMLALASLSAITVIGFYVLTSSPYPPGWIDQMGSMMTGDTSHFPVQSSSAPYFGLVFVVLVGIAVIGVAGMAYFLVMPEIRITKHQNKISIAGEQNAGLTVINENHLTPLDAVLKTLNPTERKVVEVLKAHDGKYLQKYIRNDTGLSRLQTHRTVAGLIQKDIVSAEQSGNTNVVILESWLLPKKN